MGGKNILVLDVDETLLNIEPLSFLKIFKKNYKDYNGKFIFYWRVTLPRVRVGTLATHKIFICFSQAYVKRLLSQKQSEARYGTGNI